jgi:hypothetical protein
MSKWQLVITRTDNGWLLENPDPEPAPDCLERHVIAEREERYDDQAMGDKTKGEQEAMIELLYMVKEYFAFFHSKHNKRNIVIAIEETEND